MSILLKPMDCVNVMDGLCFVARAMFVDGCEQHKFHSMHDWVCDLDRFN